MFDTVCSYPLPSDLFAQAVHPSAPVVALGLASGHVRTLRLPASTSANGAPPLPAANGIVKNGKPKLSSARRLSASSVDSCATIETKWQTRRHKGSCRALTFSADGGKLISTGTDGIVKIASAETGNVERKLLVPQETVLLRDEPFDPPTALSALTPDTLLLGTEGGSLVVYDFRASRATPEITHKSVHDDYVSSLCPLAPSAASTSGLPRQWVSTGDATLAVTDIRRGPFARSEAQDEELLCSIPLSKRVGGGQPGPGSDDERVVVGGADGGLMLFGRGGWEDARKQPGGLDSVDALCEMPESVRSGGGWSVAAGMGDGRVRILTIGQQPGMRLLRELEHDRMEGVVGIGFDAEEGRMITGGGTVVKVWRQKEEDEEASDEKESDEEERAPLNGVGKKKARVHLRDDDVSAEDESSDEDEGKRKRKKRKKSKGKGRGSNQHSVKIAGLD